MRIILINHYAGSPTLGMEYRPHYMAQEWVKLGHSVMIVGASFSHVRNRQPAAVSKSEQREEDGISYLWIPAPEYHGNGIGRIVNMFRFVFGVFRERKRLADWKPDVVIASSTYPMDVYPARSIANRSGAKLVFEVHDLWPLSPMELGGMSKYHPFIVLVQHAEDYACRKSDVVVSMLPCAKSHLESRGMSPEKYRHVPNGVVVGDGESDSPIPAALEVLIDTERDRGRFMVAYTGAHGVANALWVVVEAARIMSDESVAFFLVGDGPEKGTLRDRAREVGMDNVHFVDPVPKNAIPTLLARMDVLFIGLQKQPLFRYGISPNKLMDYMMAERPIIQSIEAGNDPVREAGCGLSIPAEDPEALTEAIRKIRMMSDEERATMGGNGRRFVSEHHEYSGLARRFIEGVDGSRD